MGLPKKPAYQNSEALVAKCYRQHSDEIRFSRARPNDSFDKAGKDFYGVKLSSGRLSIDIQVKTSPDEHTVGLVFPLPRHISFSLKERISEPMLWKIIYHLPRYPEVRCVLFVGRVGRDNPEREVLKDIWRQTLKMFRLMEKRPR